MTNYDYGDTSEPGIVTDLTSSVGTPTFGEVPQNICFVGHADLDEATDPADTSKVYQVGRASAAVDKFGPAESSFLTTAIIDAMKEGANPVYAVATPSSSETKDLSGESSPTVSLGDKHMRESAESLSFTGGDTPGSGFNVSRTFEKVENVFPEGDEVIFNPVTAQAKFSEVPSDYGDVSAEYETFDYSAAITTAQDGAADLIDFFVPLSEREDVVNEVNTTVNEMQGVYNLALCLGGADIDIETPMNFEPNYDDSRTQVIYPTRFEDGSSALAAYAGHRAQLGLDETPINRRLVNNKSLRHTLTEAERGTLIEADVVPLADESRGASIVDDLTTATNENKDERNIEFGFNRLVADYIIQTTRRNEQPYIGKLNRPGVRVTLERVVNQQLSGLSESNVVLDYNITVSAQGPTTAVVEMDIDLVEPLRFIRNEVVIENGRSGASP